jgi:hypothetical protein
MRYSTVLRKIPGPRSPDARGPGHTARARGPVRVVAAAALALAAQGCAMTFLPWNRPPAVHQVLRGEHVQVACHFDCGAVGREALATAEDAWARVAAYLAVDPGMAAARNGDEAVLLGEEPPRPLPGAPADPPTIHIYGSLRGYELTEREVAGGRFRFSAGFSDRVSRRAYLMVPDDLRPELLERTGLPDQYRRIIAHEAAHLAAYVLGEGAHWPLWLAEGLSGWVERMVVTSHHPGPVQEVNPWAGTRLWRVQHLLEQDSLPPVGEILAGTHGGLPVGDAYALWIELFHFLNESDWGEGFQETIRALARRPILEEEALYQVLQAVEARFGPVDVEGMDAAFRAHLRSLTPGWIEVFRALDPLPDDPDRWIQYSLVDLAVGPMAWRADATGDRRGFLLTGTVEPLGSDPWEIRWVLDRTGDDPLMLSVDSRGEVTLREFAYETADAPSHLLRRRLRRDLPSNRPVTFSVGVRPGVVQLRLEEDLLEVELELSGMEPSGVWGLGLERGSAAVWGELAVRPWRGGPLPFSSVVDTPPGAAGDLPLSPSLERRDSPGPPGTPDSPPVPSPLPAS